PCLCSFPQGLTHIYPHFHSLTLSLSLKVSLCLSLTFLSIGPCPWNKSSLFFSDTLTHLHDHKHARKHTHTHTHPRIPTCALLPLAGSCTSSLEFCLGGGVLCFSLHLATQTKE